MYDLLLSSSTENSTATVHLGSNIGDILTSKHRSHIAKLLYSITICVLLAHIVQSTALVMRQSRNFCRREPGSAVDGSIDIASLYSEVILVFNTGVINVYETVG